MKDVVFVCGARDFHAMDKYYLTSKILYPRKVLILTDLVESEGQPNSLGPGNIHGDSWPGE